jgi:N4-gp56 family major capsid protein
MALIDPIVFGDMVNIEVAQRLKYKEYIVTDSTLEGQAGDTITIPSWRYIGEATEVTPGVEMNTSALAQVTNDYTVKVVGKAITLTDADINFKYGDLVGEAVSQIATAIADKIDSDVVAELKKTTQSVTDTTTYLNFTTIVKAKKLIKGNTDKSKKLVLLVSTKDANNLLLDSKFVEASQINEQVLIEGYIGKIAGCYVVECSQTMGSDPETTATYGEYIEKLNEGEAILLQVGAVKNFNKKNVAIETERHSRALSTDYVASAMYVASLMKENLVVKITSKADV